MTESKSMSRDIYFRNDFYKSGSRFLLKIYKFLFCIITVTGS